MTIELKANVVFSGDAADPPDVDGAADKLRKAGFDVYRLPDKFRRHLAHPLDDFLELRIEGLDDDKLWGEIMEEVNTIVERCGGLCDECGPIEPDSTPFADLFADLFD
jgi:hypothetical protein